MGWTPTERQTEIVAWPDRVRGTPVRHLFVEGPFGSGKSHGTYISLMWEAISRHSGTHFMVAAKTLDTIQNHRDEYVEPFLDELGAWHQLGGKGWEVQSLAGSRTNTFELFAFGELNNPARVRSAQGRNIGGLLVDDAMNLSPDLRAMLVSRVRVPDASNLCWWSFNPDSDGHSFYEQMVDNTDLPSDYMNISIAENPHLPGDYIDQLLAQYPFHWQRERYIWGRRSLATGLVYGTAGLREAEGGCVVEPRLLDAFSYSVGVDHAPSNVSAAVLFAHTPDGTFLVDEWIHDGRAGVTLDDRQQAMAIWQWATANGARSIDRWTVAQDASGVRVCLEELAGEQWRVYDSSMTRSDGLNKTALMLTGGMRIFETCVNTCKEIRTYRWKQDKLSQRGQPEPDQDSAGHHADFMDAMRYGVETMPEYSERRENRVYVYS